MTYEELEFEHGLAADLATDPMLGLWERQRHRKRQRALGLQMRQRIAAGETLRALDKVPKTVIKKEKPSDTKSLGFGQMTMNLP